MQQDETVGQLESAMASFESGIDRRLFESYASAAKSLERHNRRLDDLERTIDDVPDDTLRRRLRALLGDLDESGRLICREIMHLQTYDLLDPLRVLLMDLREGQRAGANRTSETSPSETEGN